MTNRLPPGWTTATVGDACSIRNDLRLPISREERRRMPGPYPYYGPTGRLDNIATILVSGRLNVNNHAHVIESTTRCYAEWFFNFFHHRSLVPYLTRQGAGRYKLNKKALQEIQIVLPPLAEQKAINGVLRGWYVAIEKAERLCSLKQRLLRAIAERLYGLSDRKGKPVRFRELLSESTVVGSSGRSAKKLTVKLYGRGVVAKEERRRGSERTQYFVRRAGQLIYSKLDFLNGAFGLIPPELEGYESTLDLPAFDISDDINASWLLGYLTRPSYYRRQTGLARGQRVARRVHPSDFLAARVSVPPRALQDQIAAALEAAHHDLAKTSQLLDTLRIQNRGLMQKLLTGQWKLPAPPDTPGKEGD